MNNHHDGPPDDLGITGLLCISRIPEIDRCWVLDNHTQFGRRTVAGQLTYEAKHYGNKPGDPVAAKRLAADLGWWFHALTRRIKDTSAVSLIVPVPSVRQREPHNLPEVLAQGLLGAEAVARGGSVLVVDRPIPPVKVAPPGERPALVKGAFAVTAEVSGTVLLVDDLVQSGSTLSECARVLRSAGASTVVAACATRAVKVMGSPRQATNTF